MKMYSCSCDSDNSRCGILSYEIILSGGDYQSFGRTCSHHFQGKSEEEALILIKHLQQTTRFHNITWKTKTLRYLQDTDTHHINRCNYNVFCTPVMADNEIYNIILHRVCLTLFINIALTK